MNSRALVVAVVSLLAASIVADPATAREKKRKFGDAQWSDWLVAYPDREGCVPNPMHPDCAVYILFVRNRSARTLDCDGVVALNSRDLMDPYREEGASIVQPGQVAAVLEFHNLDWGKGTSYLTRCDFARDKPAPLEVPANCKMEEQRVADPEYPADSLRREETGSVILEFAADAEFGPPRAIKVIQSSGFKLLDESALKATRQNRYKSGCPGQRHRIRIGFSVPS